MLWAISGASALLYWGFSLREGTSWFRSSVKSLALVPLVVLALVLSAPLVAAALALCSLGDVFLSRSGERFFLAGLISFALGHLAWIAVFVLELGATPDQLNSVSMGLAVLAMSLHALFMIRVLLGRAGELRLPVAIYIAIIMTMGVAALATQSPMVIIGAVLFMASDTLLGLQTFILAKGGPFERAANILIWPLYWVAVAILASVSLA
ncbi:lysoplasmalogenase [Sulfitobacter aestuariivivens]|uniref:Lysoplasmalogenase n=1 Tax=Sulfitobacter aestuariivivens TaxID=2766981 RepID=A0A927HEU8_9RHOB|nr:lysoplasmalogenase [Sulfitobacter aestuariivivens]MBD3663759.1 lysoplasmalogenase [Sulfitobacter aestuariivivens]